MLTGLSSKTTDAVSTSIETAALQLNALHLLSAQDNTPIMPSNSGSITIMPKRSEFHVDVKQMQRSLLISAAPSTSCH